MGLFAKAARYLNMAGDTGKQLSLAQVCGAQQVGEQVPKWHDVGINH